MTLKSLSVTALRGTSRAELPALPTGQLGDALRMVQRDTPEETLLARAALAGLSVATGLQLQQEESPHPTLPRAVNPLPRHLWETFNNARKSLDHGLLTALCEFVINEWQAGGWSMSATQFYQLHSDNKGMFDLLQVWSLLDERAVFLLTPRYEKEYLKEKDRQAWQEKKEHLIELRRSNPEAAAAETLELWSTLNVDQRTQLIEITEKNYCQADVPLVAQAQKDRSAAVRRWSDILSARQEGPLRDEVLALTKELFAKKSKRFPSFILPAGLRTDSTKSTHADDDLLRLLDVFTYPELLEISGRTHKELDEMIYNGRYHHYSYLDNRQYESNEFWKSKKQSQLTVESLEGQLKKFIDKRVVNVHSSDHYYRLPPAELLLTLPIDSVISIPEIPEFQPPPAPTMPVDKKKIWEAELKTAHDRKIDYLQNQINQLNQVLEIRRQFIAAQSS